MIGTYDGEILLSLILVVVVLGLVIHHHYYAKHHKSVVKYPTLENAGKHVYLDDTGVCYKYRVEYIDEQSANDKNE